ncbi:AfsR/SARP family transcriptional regulator [Nonomuraea sp. NPDC049158]|uniref:AfsR/SARP family transcriptional regulator n=1 Tax=Nonomuraea sp. NPDC049158 TaxID=3155649 RepID=UPI0033F4B53D
MVRFKVLGRFDLLAGAKVCTPTAPKVGQVLAHLLMHGNQVVHIDSIIDELWEHRPPSSAITTTQTYIYQLRKIFEKEGIAASGEDVLATKLPGYVLKVKPGQLDAETFELLVSEARDLLERRVPERAVALLAEALSLWTGPPLFGVTRGPRLEAWCVQLEEQRLRALQLRIECDIQLGRHREVVGDLRSLVIINPLNEWFHERLIWVLGRSGRRAEALQAYAHLRRILRDELGLEPSPELQRLHQNLLTVPSMTAPRLVEERA